VAIFRWELLCLILLCWALRQRKSLLDLHAEVNMGWAEFAVDMLDRLVAVTQCC
jgi:hypothetical protein